MRKMKKMKKGARGRMAKGMKREMVSMAGAAMERRGNPFGKESSPGERMARKKRLEKAGA